MSFHRSRFASGLVLAAILAIPPLSCDAAGKGLASETDLTTALSPAGTRPVLVHAWASWCVPCVAEWPELARVLRSKSRRPIDVVTISLDGEKRLAEARKLLKRNSPVPGKAFVAEIGTAWSPLHDLDPEWDGSLPATWIVSADRTLLFVSRGGTRLDRLASEIDRIAPEPSVQPEGAGVGPTHRSTKGAPR